MSLTVVDSSALRASPPAVSAFADLVAEMDLVAQEHLGGELVAYKPELGEAVEAVGIFDAEYVLVGDGEKSGVEATGPAVFFRLEVLPVDPEDDEPTITIRGIDYRVTERKPDGMGGIVLMLRLVG